MTLNHTRIKLLNLYLLLFVGLCDAVPFLGPTATPTPEFSVQEAYFRIAANSFPITTEAPRLQVRQDAGTNLPRNFWGNFAPDNICGYFASPFGLTAETVIHTPYQMVCPSGWNCAVTRHPVPNQRARAARVCCTTGSCYLPTTCVHSTDSLSICGTGSCGPGTAVCTESDYPSCGTDYLLGPWGTATAWDCGRDSSGKIAYTTFDGTPDGRTWSYTSGTNSNDISDVTASATATGTESPASVVSTPSASETRYTAPANTSPGKPVGAIVGGAIGGLAVLGIVVCVLFWIQKNHSAKRDAMPSVFIPDPPPPTRPVSEPFIYPPPPQSPSSPGGHGSQIPYQHQPYEQQYQQPYEQIHQQSYQNPYQQPFEAPKPELPGHGIMPRPVLQPGQTTELP